MRQILRADAAERLGDAARALGVIAQMPDGPDGRPFWRPWRVERLVQLVLLGTEAPGWVYGRWLLEQALQQHDDRLARISRRAREAAVRVRGGRAELDRAYAVDPDLKLIDHDWVHRQCVLYEFGGLELFLRTRASPSLVKRAEQIHRWAATPMGGYRLVRRESATVRFEDVASGSPVEMPNIGSAALLLPSEHVVGRVVPSSTGPLFESVPLAVPEELARSVADEPTSWLAQLESARAVRTLDLHVHRFGFVNDLPPDLAAVAILEPDDDVSVPSFLHALRRTAEQALSGTLDWDDDDVDAWSCLAALVQSPFMLMKIDETATSADADVFELLGQRLAEPAATVCRHIADDLRAAG